MQRCGLDAVRAALDAGEDLRKVLVLRDCDDGDLLALRADLDAAGVPVVEGSERDLWRMAVDGPARALGLVGRDPDASLETLLSGAQLLWMLDGAQYTNNIGYCIRMAEASGADGLLVTGEWTSDDRHRVVRAGMKTHRFMPVHFGVDPLAVVQSFHGQSCAIEDIGTSMPWDVDLTQASLLIIGGEHGGISPAVLEAADHLIRIPMAGFTPSYNLQAPMAVVAVEALRQKRK